MKIIEFILFSMLEGTSIFIVMLAAFRFKIKEYYWQVLLICLMEAILSYVLRNQKASDFVPLFSMLLIVLFNFVVLRAPILWSFFMALVGYITFAIVQVTLVYALTLSGFVTFERIEANTVDTYIIQTATFLVVNLISAILTYRGLGFSFFFSQFRWKWENAVIISITVISIVLVAGVYFFVNQLLLASLLMTLILVFFLIMAFRKERTNDKFDG